MSLPDVGVEVLTYYGIQIVGICEVGQRQYIALSNLQTILTVENWDPPKINPTLSIGKIPKIKSNLGFKDWVFIILKFE